MYLSDDQLAFLSAAARHREDAERLLAESPDQSFHLAGFAPECAQKAVLSGRWLDKAMGHIGDPAGERALAFALAVEPAASRYELGLASSKQPALASWRVECRYEKTGTRIAEAPAAVSEATLLVDRICTVLFMDGRLPAEFGW